MSSLAEFSVALALTVGESARDFIVVPELQAEGTDKETMVAKMWINPGIKGRVQKLAASKMQSFDFDDLSVSVNFVNDYRKGITLLIDGAFANGKPYLSSMNGKLSLDPREKVSIEFTRLHSYLLWQESDFVTMLGTRLKAGADHGS